MSSLFSNDLDVGKCGEYGINGINKKHILKSKKHLRLGVNLNLLKDTVCVLVKFDPTRKM